MRCLLVWLLLTAPLLAQDIVIPSEVPEHTIVDVEVLYEPGDDDDYAKTNEQK